MQIKVIELMKVNAVVFQGHVGLRGSKIPVSRKDFRKPYANMF